MRELCQRSGHDADELRSGAKWLIRKPGESLPDCPECGRRDLIVTAHKQWPRHYRVRRWIRPEASQA